MERDASYAFVFGSSSDFATRISEPHTTFAEARKAAQDKRESGWYTGRVKKVTHAGYDEAAAKVKQGIRPSGF